MKNKRIKRAVNEIILLSHAEFISASSTQVVTQGQQRQALKILNQVQNDYFFKEETLNKDTFSHPLRSGFTLIELLVVVLIIGILAAVALPQYNLAVAKSRYTQMLTAGNALLTAIQAYELENNAFPSTFEELDFLPINGTLNETKKSITNGKFYCTFNGTQKEIYCSMSGVDIPLILLYQVSGKWKRQCRAYSAFQEKVCLGMNATLSGSGTNGYINYILP